MFLVIISFELFKDRQDSRGGVRVERRPARWAATSEVGGDQRGGRRPARWAEPERGGVGPVVKLRFPFCFHSYFSLIFSYFCVSFCYFSRSFFASVSGFLYLLETAPLRGVLELTPGLPASAPGLPATPGLPDSAPGLPAAPGLPDSAPGLQVSSPSLLKGCRLGTGLLQVKLFCVIFMHIF